MKDAHWRGRLAMFALACMTLLTTGGCSGLSDLQMSQILQSVLTTGLSLLVQAAFGVGAGV